jgi:hypothetical protein
VHYVFSSAFGGEGSANNPDCYKEGQAVEKGPKDSYGELEFQVVVRLVGKHVLREGGEYSPPIATHVQENEEEK